MKTLYVGSPLLPLKVEGSKVAQTVESTLKKKNWHEFKLATLKLTLVPYFLFNYHYYKEKEANGEKIIESSVDGFLALNGTTVLIEKDAEKLIKDNLKDAMSEAPEIPFEEKETTIEKKEQEAVLQFKAAEYFGVPKTNVVISSTKKILVPFYETFVEVKEGTFDIKINAVNGEVMGIEKVPVREKGFVEVTKETIDDLKDPKQWVEYTKGLLVETGKYTHKKSKDVVGKVIAEKPKNENKGIEISNFSEIVTSKWFLILVVIIALFLIWLGISAI